MTSSETFSPVARFLLLAAAFVVVVAGMKQAQSLLVPFLLSVFIAMLCSPLLSWLQVRRIPSSLAIVMIILMVVLAVVLLGVVVGGSIQRFGEDMPAYQQALTQMLDNVIPWLNKVGLETDAEHIRQIFNPAQAMKVVGTVLASFGNTMTNALMIILTVVFILAEQAGFAAKLVQARGGDRAALNAMESFNKAVNSYMGLKALISLLTGVLAYILLVSLGVDYAVMWALMAFLLNFVPTVGSILAALPPVLLALVQPGLGPIDALWVAVGYVLINGVVGNGIEPRVMGRGLNLSPLIVFLSLVFWGWVLGPVGMLLSIPLTIMVKIALESNSSTRWIGTLLGAGESTAVVTTEPGEEEKA